MSAYVSDSAADSNPSVLDEPVKLISGLPHCNIRPQTVSEITSMRADSHKIALNIEAESKNCDARRKYVSDLTNFLNVWILELNKLKLDLKTCNKYIRMSTDRIAELALKEKLIKVQDVIYCLNEDQYQTDSWKTIRDEQSTKLAATQTGLVAKLDELKALQKKIINDEDEFAG